MNQVESLEFIKKYTADLLSFFGENIEVEVSLRDDVIEVNIPPSPISSILIGRNADTLRSLQFMLATILRNKNAELQRVNVDIADYKKQRADRLAQKVRDWAEQVRSTGVARTEKLNPADRRIVHHVVAEYSDLRTHSDGEGLNRTITIERI